MIKPKMTKTFARFLDKEKGRVTGYSIEGDGVFIYCDSAKWCKDTGSGTFRGDTATEAMREFYDRVEKGDGTYR